MALIVQKFGGTSVGTSERIKSVAQRVAKFRTLGHQVVVVVSAISGETNKLLALAKELQAEPDPRELDVVLATGEQVTIGLLCMALLERGVSARSYTGAQVSILTDSAHTTATPTSHTVLDLTSSLLRQVCWKRGSIKPHRRAAGERKSQEK